MEGKKIKGSAVEGLIERMLLTGWSPAKVSVWLKQNRPDSYASADTIRAYRDNFIPKDRILPPSAYAQKIKEIDVMVDSLQELYNLVEVQKRRISLIIRTEDTSGITLPDARKEVELYRDLLVEICKLEMDLGVRRKIPIEIVEARFDLDKMLERFIQRRKKYAELTGSETGA